jgi:hypothetical protein
MCLASLTTVAAASPDAHAAPHFDLSTTPDWLAEGSQEDQSFGYSAASAGDVNGDGFSDLVVGTPWYDGDLPDEGRVSVYLGSAAGLTSTPVWTAEGNRARDRFGYKVASAGDVNGDGFSDILIGAPDADAHLHEHGRVFLFLGSPSGLSATPAWTAKGFRLGAFIGNSLASAGDVNGDGFSDVIIGAPFFENDQPAEGTAFLFLGSTTGPSIAPAWRAEGNDNYGEFGSSVASAGDVNGDGFGDIIVGAPGFSLGHPVIYDEGAAFLFLGSASGPSPAHAWMASGTYERSHFGAAVASAGDVNGDGFGDVIVNAPDIDSSYGGAVLFLGSASGLTAAPAWFANVNNLFFEGERLFAPSLHGVAPAGDINGDGFSDIVLAASRFGLDRRHGSAAFLLLGSPSGLSEMPAWRVDGDGTLESVFGDVASAGDVNGDGFSDVIVSAPRRHDGRGEVSLYLGSRSAPAVTPTWTAEGNQLASFGNRDGSAGRAVASAGDVNGDGFSDVLVGAPYLSGDQFGTGAAFLFLGSASGPSATPAWTAAGSRSAGFFGSTLAAAGDVNGDGFDDILVGARSFAGSEGNEGVAYLFLGSASGPSSTAAWTARGGLNEAFLGFSMASAGDVNGDGFSDVILGAVDVENPTYGKGAAILFLGSATGLSSTPAWTFVGDQVGATHVIFGTPVASAGDVNGDGFADVLVGAPFRTDGEPQEGAVFLFLGSTSGLSTSPAWTAEGDREDANFGSSVASAGDVNGDGFADILVGAPLFEHGERAEGRAVLFLGSASGPSSRPAWTAEGNQIAVQFGSSVASAGDVNGDGLSDVLVGAPSPWPLIDPSVIGGGAVFLFLGTASGASSTPAWTVEGMRRFERLGESVAAAGDFDGDGLSDILVAAPGFRHDEAVLGAAFVFTVPSTLARLPGQSSGGGPVPLLGASTMEDAIDLSGGGNHPGGRGWIRLEWEIKPLGQPFDFAGIGRSAEVEVTEGRVIPFATEVTGLQPAIFYKWRVRTANDSLQAPRAPWISIPGNNVTETKFRTAGTLQPIPFGVIGPPSDDLVFPDAPPFFSWNKGGAQTFVLEWASTQAFSGPVLMSGPIGADAAGVRTFRPDPALWRDVVQLGTPIYWRVSSDEGTSSSRALYLAPARAPSISGPALDTEFTPEDPPRLTWNPHHNERFKVRFSGSPRVVRPTIDSGGDFEITYLAWTPQDVWSQVVELSRASNGRVFWIVLALDAVGRMTSSDIGSFRIGPSEAAPDPRHPGRGRRTLPGDSRPVR